MTTKQLTGSDLREAVFEIVSRELGPAALVRYIAENFSQPGRDYTEERREGRHLSVDDIAASIRARQEALGVNRPPRQGNAVKAVPKPRRKK